MTYDGPVSLLAVNRGEGSRGHMTSRIRLGGGGAMTAPASVGHAGVTGQLRGGGGSDPHPDPVRRSHRASDER